MALCMCGHMTCVVVFLNWPKQIVPQAIFPLGAGGGGGGVVQCMCGHVTCSKGTCVEEQLPITSCHGCVVNPCKCQECSGVLNILTP